MGGGNRNYRALAKKKQQYALKHRKQVEIDKEEKPKDSEAIKSIIELWKKSQEKKK